MFTIFYITPFVVVQSFIHKIKKSKGIPLFLINNGI